MADLIFEFKGNIDDMSAVKHELFQQFLYLEKYNSGVLNGPVIITFIFGLYDPTGCLMVNHIFSLMKFINEFRISGRIPRAISFDMEIKKRKVNYDEPEYIKVIISQYSKFDYLNNCIELNKNPILIIDITGPVLNSKKISKLFFDKYYSIPYSSRPLLTYCKLMDMDLIFTMNQNKIDKHYNAAFTLIKNMHVMKNYRLTGELKFHKLNIEQKLVDNEIKIKEKLTIKLYPYMY